MNSPSVEALERRFDKFLMDIPIKYDSEEEAKTIQKYTNGVRI